jgi:translation elongation factor EF-4
MDIIKERLWREYKMETIFTTPTVTYLVKTKNLKDERVLSQANIKALVHA